MIFSKRQLNQLAETNGYSINSLISSRKELVTLNEKKIRLQNEIKDVLSSSDDLLPGGSSLLMGTINTTLLTSLGYSSIQGLINEFETNNDAIEKIKQNVVKEDEKIKSSLEILGDVDITKDMRDQVTQQVLLDSDLAEVKNNSQEILLMLSQSKSGADILKTAMEHTTANEKKLIAYIEQGKKREIFLNEQANDQISSLNDSTNALTDKLSLLAQKSDDGTFLEKLNTKISSLSKTEKNILLGATFISFLGMGIATNSNSKQEKTNKEPKDEKN